MNIKPMPLRAVAEHLGADIEGNAEQEISGAASLDEAGAGDLSFLTNPRYAEQLAGTRAAAVVTDREQAAQGITLLRMDNPYLGFARALTLLLEKERPVPGVHKGAHVEPSAKLAEGATVMAGAYVGAQSVLGENTVLYPGAVLMERVRIGAHCLLYPGAVVREDCVLGDRVILNPNVSIGGDGFGFAQHGAAHVKIPQIGNVVIGDDVEVGAGTCIDRAALGSTVVGSGSKIDNQVMIAHGCKIGENVIIVAQSGLAGSATIEQGATLGARAGVLGHLTVGAGALLYSRAHVTKSVPAGAVVSGNPARTHKENLKQAALLGRMEKLLKRVDELEKQVAGLQGEE
ncbi:MAG: UDP-3-O-(3-hydroxymyristoyl)glucosamine N-acyltransferase [SAR324 cluster bacterium]|nr:UDP-3-O-(3-hydroxymyristoyl)glucosamine N-acyltransferase [SAR324 cluster bacterium]